MSQRTRRLLVPAAVIVVSAIAACTTGTASTSPAPASPGEGASIQVTLQEWAIVPASDSVAAGDVTFQVTNSGPEDVHEYVVLRTDLDPNALPTDATGAVSEEGEGIEVIDEIEDIPVGESRDLTVALTAGDYVLLCNIYDETEQESHYQLGMRTAFAVTE
jgi:uncharacterized cupredoxin-like copper-binding protein